MVEHTHARWYEKNLFSRLGWSCMPLGFLDSYLYIGVSCDIQEMNKYVVDFLSLILLPWCLYSNFYTESREKIMFGKSPCQKMVNLYVSFHDA